MLQTRQKVFPIVPKCLKMSTSDASLSERTCLSASGWGLSTIEALWRKWSWYLLRYTVVPVSGPMDLESCLVEHLEQVQHVVLINCGAAFDVVEAMQQSDEVIFYVIDRFAERMANALIRKSNLDSYPDLLCSPPLSFMPQSPPPGRLQRVQFSSSEASRTRERKTRISRVRGCLQRRGRGRGWGDGRWIRRR